MPSEAELLEALRPVEDPELHRSVVDLDMVREVRVEGATARVVIALTVPGCPLKAEITARVSDALTAMDGIEAADVEFTSMSEEERARLRGKLGHQAAGAELRTSVFASGESRARVLAVASGKGGVGKSTITANLAVALARAGARVGVLDADVWGFSIPRMLGVDRPPIVIDDMIVPPEVHGVTVTSMGFFVDEDRPVIWRGPMLHKALEQFLCDVHWGTDLDYLVVDMPPGTGDVAISMAQFLPGAEILVVTTPQPAAQAVAQRAGLMAEKVDHDVVGVIENMSWLDLPGGERRRIFGEGGGQELAGKLGVPLLGQVPIDEAMREGADTGRPIVATDPDSPGARALRDIAGKVAAMGRRRVRRPELTITPG